MTAGPVELNVTFLSPVEVSHASCVCDRKLTRFVASQFDQTILSFFLSRAYCRCQRRFEPFCRSIQ